MLENFGKYVMKKIIVIGCPGSGKSTFSRSLQKVIKIPLFHLDLLYWNADRTIVEESIFHQRINEIIQKDEWIIDGNYGSTMELRLQECDTVFFLDYPLEVCLNGIKERKGKIRTDMPWQEKEDEEDIEFNTFVKNFDIQNRPRILELLKKYFYKEIHIFKNRNEADEFIYQLEKKK